MPARRCRRAPAAILGPSILFAAAAGAQEGERSLSVLDLPRPGYERRVHRVGPLLVTPEVTARTLYNSNIYATSSDPRDDIVVRVEPRIGATLDRGRVRASGVAYVSRAEFLRQPTESRTTFGVGLDGSYLPTHRARLSTGIGFDRLVQSRTDPERRTEPFRPPVAIDASRAQFGYTHQGNRVVLRLQGTAERYDFRSAIEDDRDLLTYTVAGSAGFRARRVEVFGRGYRTRRDARLARDFDGVNRDSTTTGVLGGINLDLAARLQGEVAVGVFDADPADPRLRDFSGIAANGRVTWTPRRRTAITLDAFRGDVATVRTGAAGRIDGRVALQLDQEIRHDLLLQLHASYADTSYRNLADGDFRTLAGTGEVEYLIDRRWSAIGSIGYVHRTAGRERDRFDRALVSAGVRSAF